MFAQGRAQRAEVGAFVQHGEGFGPGQGGAFGGAEVADVAPDHQAVQALVAFAVFPGFAGVHLHAEAALVDLRGAQHHQVMQLAIQAMGVDQAVDLAQAVEDLGDGLQQVDGLGGVAG